MPRYGIDNKDAPCFRVNSWKGIREEVPLSSLTFGYTAQFVLARHLHGQLASNTLVSSLFNQIFKNDS